MKYQQLSPGTYVAAISGGVDSVVLLDLLGKQKDITIVVAHFDHGMRKESQKDARFVEELAKKYRCPFELGSANLGNVGEAVAREARYDFLHDVKSQYKADAIITAHHSDDIIETIIINIVRGTGWKGLSSLRDNDDLKRPLLDSSKDKIEDYAKKHNLTWVEDETNRDEKYLRNHIRHNVLADIDQSKKQQFLDLYYDQLKLHKQIGKHTAVMATDRRHNYIMWPRQVALEVLRAQYTLTRPQAIRALHAIKTAKPGTLFDISSSHTFEFSKEKILLTHKNKTDDLSVHMVK